MEESNLTDAKFPIYHYPLPFYTLSLLTKFSLSHTLVKSFDKTSKTN